MFYYRLEATLTFGPYSVVHMYSRQTTSLIFDILQWKFHDSDQCRSAFENELHLHACHYGTEAVRLFKYILAQNCLYDTTWLKHFIFLIPPSQYRPILFDENERNFKRVNGG